MSINPHPNPLPRSILALNLNLSRGRGKLLFLSLSRRMSLLRSKKIECTRGKLLFLSLSRRMSLLRSKKIECTRGKLLFLSLSRRMSLLRSKKIECGRGQGEGVALSHIKYLIITLLLILTLNASASTDRYVFNTEVQQQRFQSLNQQIRCLVCQGQSIGDSDSYFSQNMKDWLHEAILDGHSDYEIRLQLIDKYGEKIFYDPGMNANTLLLWALPALFLFIGLILFLRRGR